MQVPGMMNNMESRNATVFNPRPVIPRPYTLDSTPSLPGFYINSEEDIRAKDVPMDGSISFFPYRDLSRIEIRQWNGAGNIERLSYILDAPKDQKAEEISNEPRKPSSEELILGTLNDINQGLSSTFTTFASVLKDMQTSMSDISKRLDKMDGGVG